MDNLPRVRNDGTPIPFPPADPHLTPFQQAVKDLPIFHANGFKTPMELRRAEDSLDHVYFSEKERRIIAMRWAQLGGRYTLQQVADAYEQHVSMELELQREGTP